MEGLTALATVVDLFSRVQGLARSIETAYDTAMENDKGATDCFNEMWRAANRINARLSQHTLCTSGAGSSAVGYESNVLQLLEQLDYELYCAYEGVFKLVLTCG